MKILHIYTGGGEIYGVERVIYHLMTEHLKCGYDVKVAYFKRSSRNSFLDLLNDHGIPVVIVPSTGILDINAFMTLRRVCFDFSPHILHAHGYKGYIFAAFLKRLLNKLFIVSTKHISDDSSFRIKVYEYLGDKSLLSFDEVIAVSQFTKDKLAEKGIPAGNIEVIHNGVEIPLNGGTAKERIRSELNIDSDSRLLGFIGRLAPQKGISCLLQAAQKICTRTADVSLVIIGDGELKNEAESFIASNNLGGRVFMLGWRKDATDLLEDIDVLLLPSIFEGLPMIILEAMARGVPVIATDVGGIGEAVKDGETGLLIKPGDPDAIVTSVFELFDNPELAEKISRNSFERAKTRFSSEHMAERYKEVYLKLLNGAEK
jgi:glycosyltransferase involved in cell wall biosynthesis